ncbi:IucA/IucC family siderophore biosynthesis protein [Dyella sp. LX-66]|uniref:IucA/IucC family protein n=1 Tax=unclassified Dyella TaxID=2634549 RepID=UPI001BDF72BE|nr:MULTISPECIES: IucA/IucC family siderophore biosynthesis protein [unclassified Dyella]MBT2117007.1 IucA/IucC family siderophore biosynthesis protein [Dyella sp. LX-1]MBT2139917.1 IucA/IucC family siderophore biosynthesis protein [Dyella sp. LX-66]
MNRGDNSYIAWRIIDCCLREDLRGIVHRGSEAAPAPAARQVWPEQSFPERWWRIAHLPGGVLWLPVQASDYMQSLRALGDGWLRETPQGLAYEHGADAWLALLAEGLDEETCQLHRDYAAEARCAAEHRTLSRQAYRTRTDALAGTLNAPTWDERALRCDQVASYRDHPFYPTARAKSGFGETDMRAYAPEFDPSFALRWLAVPRDALQLTTPQPAFWPGMRDVGLDETLAATHTLLPVHPLTWPRLDEGDAFPLPPDTHRAPLAWLSVRPTLSVRTVMPVNHPGCHIKLPLLMRTLGALNLRLIKPSTLYDGHWFAQALTAIEENDAALRNRYVHVDEAHGGHVDEARHLAYLVRGYPSLPDATLVPAAALSSTMPDGRPFAAHLADRFHQGDLLAWWQSYVSLLSDVHLRLWLAYGVALEANQQNTVLIYAPEQAPRLLMKDNDSARVLLPRLRARLPRIESLGALRDPRIPVEDDAALARMFCTIILQLDLLAVLEGVAEWQAAWREPMYAVLRRTLRATLVELERQGIDTQPAERLLQSPWLPVKYLLSAGSLLSKRITGASDINKFYGDSGPNFMLADETAAGARHADGAA